MDDHAPSISVIIPTHNRREIVLRCLRALAAQSLAPSAFEILVIDDGSADGTAGAVRKAAAAMEQAVGCISQPNGGANAARNAGIACARGRLLLIINDDTIATPGLLAAHLRAHDQHPAEEVAVLGRLAISPDLPPSIFLDLHHDPTLDGLPDGADLGWQYFMTFNLSVKADFLRRHGGFDLNLRWHEDVEFGLRLAQHGLRVILSRGALAYHYHPMTEEKYLGIAARDGEALARWYRRSPELLPHLTGIGLHSRSLGTRATRHVVADAAINRWTWPGCLLLARGLQGAAPRTAAALYRKLFQVRRRQAIEAGLAGIDPCPH